MTIKELGQSIYFYVNAKPSITVTVLAYFNNMHFLTPVNQSAC